MFEHYSNEGIFHNEVLFSAWRKKIAKNQTKNQLGKLPNCYFDLFIYFYASESAQKFKKNGSITTNCSYRNISIFSRCAPEPNEKLQQHCWVKSCIAPKQREEGGISERNGRETYINQINTSSRVLLLLFFTFFRFNCRHFVTKTWKQKEKRSSTGRPAAVASARCSFKHAG